MALDVHLALLAIRRRAGQSRDTERAARSFRDRLDRAALAGAVAGPGRDADLDALALRPLLQLGQLDTYRRYSSARYSFPLSLVTLFRSLRAGARFFSVSM